ncbi:MAG: hypothetical protein ABI165_15090 [Bryobacteraceae bacterium]
MADAMLVRCMFARKNKWKGGAAGAAGGLLAAFAMNRFQSLWSATAKKLSNGKNQQSGGGRRERQRQSRRGDFAWRFSVTR